jgi:hypothetical protein
VPLVRAPRPVLALPLVLPLRLGLAELLWSPWPMAPGRWLLPASQPVASDWRLVPAPARPATGPRSAGASHHRSSEMAWRLVPAASWTVTSHWRLVPAEPQPVRKRFLQAWAVSDPLREGVVRARAVPQDVALQKLAVRTPLPRHRRPPRLLSPRRPRARTARRFRTPRGALGRHARGSPRQLQSECG